MLAERKTSLITVFSHLLKRLETFDIEKEKVVGSNFQKRLNFEKKLERTRTRIKIMLSASHPKVFSHEKSRY